MLWSWKKDDDDENIAKFDFMQEDSKQSPILRQESYFNKKRATHTC